MLEDKVSAAKQLNMIHEGYLTLITDGNLWALARVAAVRETSLLAIIITILDVEDRALGAQWDPGMLVTATAENVYFLGTVEQAEWRANSLWNSHELVNTHLAHDAPTIAFYVARYFNNESLESARLAARAAGAIWPNL